MATTKIFKSGNAMAVRLPASFKAVAGTPVEVREEQGRWVVEALAAKDEGYIDLTGIAGSMPWLKPLSEEDRRIDERELDWEGKLRGRG